RADRRLDPLPPRLLRGDGRDLLRHEHHLRRRQRRVEGVLPLEARLRDPELRADRDPPRREPARRRRRPGLRLRRLAPPHLAGTKNPAPAGFFVMGRMYARAVRASPLVLGIETSCDDTACALVDGEGRVVASVVSSQLAAHRPYGGVVPEIA